jgi:D-3-phosphoglycerate dehydrogenase / 2-oxoglutarate reductase
MQSISLWLSILTDLVFCRSILEVISDGNINIEEIENIIFEGGVAASCNMKLMAAVTADMLKKMQDNPQVISVSHVAL